MAGSTYVNGCGAAHLFDAMGTLTDWNPETETGASEMSHKPTASLYSPVVVGNCFR